MKKITVIGIGKLGICLALNLEKCGFDVLGMDVDSKYIDKINKKSLKSAEPQVEALLKSSKNFKTTTSLMEAVNYSNILFVVVSTPSLPNGKYDHKHLEKLCEDIKSMSFVETKYLIICCTTMPGYCNKMANKMKNINCKIIYNPEFIAQGNIIENQTHPDLILIGEEKKEGDVIVDVYKKMTKNNPPIHRMDRLGAEIAKIAINCYITMKISYANMIGDVCNAVGINPERVLLSIGEDDRIGKKCLKYGYGFGGPCFPRDNRAFSVFAKESGINAILSKSTDNSNGLHLKYQIQNFLRNNPKIKKITLGPVSYKPDVPIIEESQQLAFAIELSNVGIDVTIEDSEETIEQVKKIYEKKFKYIIKK